MKRLLFFQLLILLSLPSRGQYTVQFPGSWSLSGGYHYGFMVAHRPAIIHLQQRHVRGYEVTWQKLPSDSGGWRNVYGYPWLGITYLNYDLGNPTELGLAQAILPSIYFPLVRKKPLSLVFRFGWGLGYIEKSFNTEDNYKNLAIGSHWNSSVNAAVLFRCPVSSKFQVNGGISFSHFSNGSSQLPNLGINIATVQTGLQYYFGTEQRRTKVPVTDKRSGIEYSFSAVAGIKDIYPPGGDRYVPVNVSFNVLKDFTTKSMYGGGTDLSYDESMEQRLEPDKREGFESCVRVGIHGTYGLHVGKVDGLIQLGTYLYNPMDLDGDFYNRLVFRYHATQKLFFSFSLKSHYAKADYIEWGLGYSFRK